MSRISTQNVNSGLRTVLQTLVHALRGLPKLYKYIVQTIFINQYKFTFYVHYVCNMWFILLICLDCIHIQVSKIFLNLVQVVFFVKVKK